MDDTTPAYRPRRAGTSDFVALRGLRYHVNRWQGSASAGAPPLVMLHGWMDVGASFQFVVDALAAADGFDRDVLAPDWRGYGQTESPPTDSYWFPDYVGDLDALLDAVSPAAPVDLAGHSMGGNVAMLYAGVRPQRVRRLVNLEGFGMPPSDPERAPARLAQWLDELKAPAALRSYESERAVAERLLRNNPRLAPDKAAWLAPRWAQPRADGRWHVLGDPAHRRVNPVLSRKDESLAAWRRIAAPVLWVEGELTELDAIWRGRYTRADFEGRLALVPAVERAVVAGAGHMLHHDRPEAVARLLAGFLGGEAAA